jgi:hypothetical protein
MRVTGAAVTLVSSEVHALVTAILERRVAGSRAHASDTRMCFGAKLVAGAAVRGIAHHISARRSTSGLRARLRAFPVRAKELRGADDSASAAVSRVAQSERATVAAEYPSYAARGNTGALFTNLTGCAAEATSAAVLRVTREVHARI